jgi:hypothetical protein
MSESEAESKVKSYDLNEVKPGALGHFARPGWWGPFAEQASTLPAARIPILWNQAGTGVLNAWVESVDSTGSAWHGRVRHRYQGQTHGWREAMQTQGVEVVAPWDAKQTLLGCSRIVLVNYDPDVQVGLYVTLAPGCGVVLVEEDTDEGWRRRYWLTVDPRVEAVSDKLGASCVESLKDGPPTTATVDTATFDLGLLGPSVEATEVPQRPADSDVAHPSHYTRGKVECIDAIEAAVQGLDPVAAVLVGQSIKYLWRHAHKGTPVKDLEKAAWYLERLTRHVAAKETK